MLTKEYINELKIKGNGALLKAISEFTDSGTLASLLEKLGYLPKDFDGNLLIPLLNHESHQIRLGAVKNIGKLEDIKYIQILSKIARQDTDSMVRREAVSSIGRMRHPQNKSILIEMLNDLDPKIVLQAIRGLLVFKNDKVVENSLKQLYKHPNEMVQTVIRKEFFTQSTNKTGQPHTKTYEFLKNVVVNGDVRDVLKIVPDESIHLTFTSPPYYNARDYSIYQSYQEYLQFLDKVFREVYRVTKEGRFFVLNTSPIIIPRVSRQHSSKRYPIPFDIHAFLVNMGWEFIDDIIWLKPETSVKNRNAGFLQHRKPLGYKSNPVTEYLMVYRKKTEKLIDWNIRQYDWEVVKKSKVMEEYETSNVWKIDPTFNKVHTAVFPLELCNRVIKFYSFKGDLVFDPFAGSGTLGKAARKLERLFFLTEQDEKYFELIRNDLSNKTIFSDKEPKFFTLEQFKKII
ncbi:MAG: HEAT repeat domain-containing protein [Candidatus Stahlbacteria bacterium]|nr:HEAT repeat domain-containing protein [Candidatus Stahlbacteria bacterium]